jgi:hypothetical protein
MMGGWGNGGWGMGDGGWVEGGRGGEGGGGAYQIRVRSRTLPFFARPQQ